LETRRFIKHNATTIRPDRRFSKFSSPVTDSLFHITGRYATVGALMLYAFRYLEATALPLFMKGFLASFAFVYFL
jgi:hypothetical protein